MIARTKAEPGIPSENAPGSNEEDQVAGSPRLAVFGPMVDEAIAFASKWPAEFRGAVVQFALDQLRESRSTESARVIVTQQKNASEDSVRTLEAPFSRLARSVGVARDELARVVSISENGQIRIMGRLDGSSKRELQRNYSNVYAFLKEQAFGELHMGVEELRQLCTEHGCYDSANFTANYRLDNLLREVGGKGPKERCYVASKTALTHGEALLRAMLAL